MAKTMWKRAGNSRIRFVMVDADLGDGQNLTEITQVISNALRPQAVRMIAAPARSEGGNGGVVTDQVEQEIEETEEVVDEVQETEDTPRSPKPRKFPIPRAVPDLDLTSGEMPFETFAREKGLPEKDLKRYLLVAYWCKKYRGIEAVSADHVYTAYKIVSWGTDIRDFAQPFRDLQRSGRGVFKSPNFTINQVGEAVVEKMKAK
jgi:hypothetical protein